MSGKYDVMDETARLILHRTPREEVAQGITIMVKGEGVRVIDKTGRSYLDMVAGVTRPTHIGYGREEVARAAGAGDKFANLITSIQLNCFIKIPLAVMTTPLACV